MNVHRRGDPAPLRFHHRHQFWSDHRFPALAGRQRVQIDSQAGLGPFANFRSLELHRRWRGAGNHIGAQPRYIV